MERRQFTWEFKAHVVRAFEYGHLSEAQIARELNINVKLLYHWRSEVQHAGTVAIPSQGHFSEEEGMPWKM